MGEGHLEVEGTVHAFCLPLISFGKLKYEVHEIWDGGVLYIWCIENIKSLNFIN